MLFNMKEVDALAKRMVEVLTEHMDDDLTFTFDGGKYGADVATLKIKIVAGAPADAQRIEWERNCRRIGMQPEDLGGIFLYRNERIEVIGARPNGRKYTVCGKNCATGVVRYYPADPVRRTLKRKPAAVQERHQGVGLSMMTDGGTF